MYELLNHPDDADGVNTFSFGYMPTEFDPDECEKACLAEPRCYIYTFYTYYHEELFMNGECMGVAYETGINVIQDQVFSGVRSFVAKGKY